MVAGRTAFCLVALDNSQAKHRLFGGFGVEGAQSKTGANPVLIESGFALFSLCGRIFGRRTGVHPRIKSEGMLRLENAPVNGAANPAGF
jgi:hypothetical protein